MNAQLYGDPNLRVSKLSDRKEEMAVVPSSVRNSVLFRVSVCREDKFPETAARKASVS